jgi:hypothetical protein
MADSRDASRNNGRRNNNRSNNNRNRNNHNNTYEEADPYNNGNRPAGSKNWRVQFRNSRKVRPVNKEGRSKPLGNKHKTRTRRKLGNHFPDEMNVLNMISKSSYASRVASETAALHAKHNTLADMLRELEAKPMNYRIKSLIRTNLQRKFYNLTGPMPQRLPPRVPYRPPMYQGLAFSAAVANANNDLYK